MSLSLAKQVFIGFGLLSVGAFNLANAGLQDQIDGVFNGMTNVTPTGVYDSQRRGVLFGGSLEGRFEVMRPNILTFSPPSLDAGCGGLSMFGGSFSFINADEFTQLLRDIAQNAVGYAFSIAIDAMCPTCADEMQKLQSRIQDLNGLAKSSCQIATSLVDAARGPGANDKKQQKTMIDGVASGMVGGISDFLGEINGALTPTQQTAQNSTAAEKLAASSNSVWELIESKQVESWFFVGGDDEVKRILMSLMGTYVNAYEDDDIWAGYYPPTISFKDFFSNDDVNAEESTVEAYTCDTAADPKCLSPFIGPPITITPMRQRVKAMLLGDGANPGIIDKWINNAGALDDPEQQFLSVAPAPVLAMIRNTAHEPGTSRMVLERSIDMIAMEMTRQLIDELMKSMTIAVSQDPFSEQADVDQMHSLFQERRTEMNLQQQVIAENQDKLENVMSLYDNVRRSLHIKRYPFGIERPRNRNGG